VLKSLHKLLIANKKLVGFADLRELINQLLIKRMTNIEIDKNSGFCFGVDEAIKIAELELKKGNKLYCLGQIVHNDMEVKRLEKLGMITLSYDEFKEIKNVHVLLRAHGEPPETYRIAKENNIKLIDATCPIVSKFQQRVKKSYATSGDGVQIVIYGKKTHPEVIGLAGQIGYKAIVVEDESGLNAIDFDKPVKLYSQTTKSTESYNKITDSIKQKMTLNKGQENLKVNNTLCRHVSGREPNLIEFAKKHDVVIFVSGKKSSNGKMLYGVCRQANPNTFFISSTDELKKEWVENTKSIGICGATSTPKWLMEKTKEEINRYKLRNPEP
jgi:4-hydroxy-3-methylbut-2-enyl diphosphate reductase